MNRTMKNFIFASLLLSMALCLSGCQSMWHLFLNCVVDIAPDRFSFEENNNKLSIPVFTSHALESTNEELKRLIVVIHGAGLNARKSFDTGKKIVDAFEDSKDQYLVVAPQFLEGIEPEETGLLFWGRQWRSGGVSISEELNEGLPTVSSYEVMDKLIRAVTENNPNINLVIMLGHSAGGPFVARYAAINKSHDVLRKQGVSIHYVIANPSSYLYLDATRYRFNSNGEILKHSIADLRSCQNYNNYKYGLKQPYGYAETIPKRTIIADFTTRSVFFLLGSEDKERSWSLDKSCEVEVQGKNRYERGLLYQHHLNAFTKNGPHSEHHWMIIPGVGHDSDKMLTHVNVIEKLKSLTY